MWITVSTADNSIYNLVKEFSSLSSHFVYIFVEVLLQHACYSILRLKLSIIDYTIFVKIGMQSYERTTVKTDSAIYIQRHYCGTCGV